jgi:DNA-binding MarR family transcriptional regulator
VATTSEILLQERMIDLIRAFGLHRPDTTPCGKPVSVSEAHALLELARGEPPTQTELATRLHLEKSTVSRLVGQLVERGWVGRERDGRDARALRLVLTERGARAEREIGQARRRKFEALLERIPTAERDAVVRALDILVEAMRATA